MNSLRKIATLFLMLTLSSSQAWAFFSGRTVVDSADLKSDPTADAPTLESLPRGTAFNAADTPKNGYYRVRTKSALGWLRGEDIGKASPTKKDSRPTARRRPVDGPKTPAFFLGRVLLDYNSHKPSELNTATGTQDFNGGTSFGAELGWFPDPRWGVLLRIEYLAKSLTGEDSADRTGNTFEFSFKSIPIQVGGLYRYPLNDQFYIGGAGFVGIAPTKFTSNVTASPSGSSALGATEFSSSPLTFILKGELGMKLSDSFGLIGELGYRSLKTSKMSATSSTSGSSIFGSPPTLTLDLSGIFFGAGLQLKF